MTIFKKAMEYLNGPAWDTLDNYYVNDLLYNVALVFVIAMGVIFGALTRVILFITCPIWFIPYFIFRSLKENIKSKKKVIKFKK